MATTIVQQWWKGLDRLGWRIFLVAVLLQAAASYAQSKHEYAADGVRIVILPVGKQAGREDYESKLEFRAVRNEVLCAMDFASKDSEHGFGVVKAEWTPDKQFFVFSLTSSGGHQSWHAPTYFYNRATRSIRLLDDYQNGAGIASGDFRLIAPNTIETKIQKENEISIRFKLSSLNKPIPRNEKPFQFTCDRGRVFREAE